MSIVLKAENISKQYRLGEVGTGTISHDLNRWWAKVRKKEDPFLKIGESNDRTNIGESDYVWALENINFEVIQGQAVGIIGRNGAGKSTLLKLLSKVTQPTTGEIKVKGRIASLLEVGTGFHPEMTGRENIFLNGAILGMTRKEIRRKFDEIVEFAGVERYIDTPVKRYSSGMYVRLAFSVAAHLESEILIVDEVLAVGDAEFQRKCLGKMNDVTRGEGRTVLFVSHNMASVQNLCESAFLMKNGKILNQDKTEIIIDNYMQEYAVEYTPLHEILERKGNGKLRFVDIKIEAMEGTNEVLESFGAFKITLYFDQSIVWKNFNGQIDIGINNNIGNRVAWLSSSNMKLHNREKSNYLSFIIKNNPLAPGNYSCNLYCEINKELSDWLTEISPFSIVEKDYYNSGKLTPPNQGNILLNYEII